MFSSLRWTWNSVRVIFSPISYCVFYHSCVFKIQALQLDSKELYLCVVASALIRRRRTSTLMVGATVALPRLHRHRYNIQCHSNHDSRCVGENMHSLQSISTIRTDNVVIYTHYLWNICISISSRAATSIRVVSSGPSPGAE